MEVVVLGAQEGQRDLGVQAVQILEVQAGQENQQDPVGQWWTHLWDPTETYKRTNSVHLQRAVFCTVHGSDHKIQDIFCSSYKH